MSAQETVTVNPDGSTTFEDSTPPPPVDDPNINEEGAFFAEEAILSKGTDPAISLLFLAILLGVLYYMYIRKSRQDNEDDFFSNLDGEKVRP
jgi:hypothetical protein